MRVWKFRNHRDGARFIAPSSAAAARYRRHALPVCRDCGTRNCAWLVDELRGDELLAVGCRRDPVETRRFVAGGEDARLVTHQGGRFYRAIQALPENEPDPQREALREWYASFVEVTA